ncbi:MAG: hypothetical protein H0U75_05575 [Legionella sp.]|nr:hypothetical protein [Legionella sp.]
MNLFRSIILLMVCMSTAVFAEADVETQPVHATLPKVGSWIFSGVATNEGGERFGYFFQMQRQGSVFHAKTALIDGQTNKLIFFYDGQETIEATTNVDWHVGPSFLRYNPINDSWIFGLKLAEKKGFNFKVDMLKKDNEDNETLELKPGVELQALETTRLNGHIKTDVNNKEQFVIGNKAWFARVWLTKAQKEGPAISTTFCRLNNDNGFYAANLKEPITDKNGVAGWRDAAGVKLKMSKGISIKSLANDECLLHVGFPRVDMKLVNTLKSEDHSTPTLAGFSSKFPLGFCFVEEQSFLPFV